MFRTTTNKSTCHHARVEDAGTGIARGDGGASTATGETSQILISREDRRKEHGRRTVIHPPSSCTVDKYMPQLLLLEENDRIQTFLHGLVHGSRLPNRVNDVPRYDAKTLVKGRLLGKGTFCSVYKFRRGLLLLDNENGRDETISTTTESCNFENQFDGKLMTNSLKKPWLSQLPLRKIWSRLNSPRSTPKYVIKTMNEENLDVLESKELFVRSVAYLAAEIRMLSGLDHPHIIRLYGWGSETENIEEHDKKTMFQYGNFMVLERLPRILKEQLKEWELKRRNIAGCFEAGKRYPDDAKIIGATSVFHEYNRKRQIDFMNRLYRKRIVVAMQLSSAIAYLHERNILHRDVKPQNIGFDAEGNVRLFDLGVAKEIILSGKTKTRTQANPRTITDNDDDAGDEVNERLYHLTGLVGSRSYMSPENGLHQPYNAKTDVYSFSVVLWELMTLRKLPHRRYSNSKLETQVWMGPDHERPSLTSISECKPKPVPSPCCCFCENEKVAGSASILLERPIRNLLHQCWSPMIHERPTMKSVHEALELHLLEISRGVAAGNGRLLITVY